MSTRTRIVLDLDGYIYSGPKAISVIKGEAGKVKIGYKPPAPFTTDDMQAALKLIAPFYQRVGFHIFREPRRIRDVRSRYKRIVLRYGLGRRRGRSVGGDGGLVTQAPGRPVSLATDSIFRTTRTARIPASIPGPPIPEQQSANQAANAAVDRWMQGTTLTNWGFGGAAPVQENEAIDVSDHF